LKQDLKIDDLAPLAVFATVIRSGSMSAAARALGTTPSAVSQRIRALESRHALRLLNRTTRRLAPTEAGAQLLAHCDAMLQAAQAAHASLERSRDALDGELRLAAPVGFARHVAPALAPLLDAHPALRLHLAVDDAMIDLLAHRIDLALRAGTLADSSWVARRLCAFERPRIRASSRRTRGCRSGRAGCACRWTAPGERPSCSRPRRAPSATTS
jgi:DNA-binding transcriptional LysR family regulator